MNFCIPCLFGIESLCADELKQLGYEDVKTLNGQVLFSGKEKDIANTNINIRTGERVLIVIGSAPARSFDELFEAVRAMQWENYIPSDGSFPVKGHSLKSKLQSIPDCQKIIKKATVERLREKHKTQTLTETAAKYPIQFAIRDDIATMYLDTSGEPLYKRGYRSSSNTVLAPLRETLAAAIVKLSRYKGKEIVYDPFCGSGTIPIEAAMAALCRAPGLKRAFAAELWTWLDKKTWSNTKEEAISKEYKGDYCINGSDIDPKCVETAVANAKSAGVAEQISFKTADATKPEIYKDILISAERDKNTIIMTNPPYGERVMQKNEAEELYRGFGAAVHELDNRRMYVLSSHTQFEQTFGKIAVKKRKLYNGMIKCDLFMYF